jgi:hypothetical protein
MIDEDAVWQINIWMLDKYEVDHKTTQDVG